LKKLLVTAALLAALCAGVALGWLLHPAPPPAEKGGAGRVEPPEPKPPAPRPTPRAPSAPRVDLRKLCLQLATVQEPEVDLAAMRKGLDGLQAAALGELKSAKDPAAKVAALNRALLADRQVTYISNKYWRDSTLAASVLRGRGNCLSTTTLYAVIGQRLGLPIRAVLVPGHALARYDDGKTRINIETTAGGKPLPDEHYQARHGWTTVDARVLGHGRSLTDAEFGAVLRQAAGRHLVLVDKPEVALRQLDLALKLWPNNPHLRLDRAGILLSAPGRREEALKEHRELLSKSESPEIRSRAGLNLAGDLQARGAHRRALALLRAVYRRAPKHLHNPVLSAMASSYRTLRRFDEAALAMELALSLDGDAEDFSGLAIFYKNAGKLEDAIRCLKISLAKNPESWNTRLILAGYLIRAGRKEEGWKVFATVKKPRVNLQFYHTNMAWFHGSAGKKKEFLRHLEAALKLARSPGILNYINTEVDFDRYRQDADFKALVERYRRKLAPRKDATVPR
jgi:tetratricopeptide (TPR) repeat protein